jgi:hypothetical protein
MARKAQGEPKRKPKEAMEQSALRLPAALREQLRRAGGDGGMGEEIRRRLEASFAAEKTPADPKTQELFDAIAYIADKTGRYWGSWAEDPFAHEVLATAVTLFLAGRRPKGEAVQKRKSTPEASGFQDVLFGPDATPESIGRFLLANWQWARHEGERSK